MKYITLGVIAAALFLNGTGQMPFAQAAAPAKPAAKPVAKPAMDPSVRQYLQTLRTDTNQNKRSNAAQQLGILLAAPHPVVPEVLDQLHKTLVTDISPQVRVLAANAIARINQASSVDKLLNSITTNHGKADVQLAIIRAIGDMREKSLKTVPILVRFLRSPDQFVREQTVDALWKIRPKDPRVARALNELLAQEDELVVKLTLTIDIADFKSPESIPILQKIVKNTSEQLDVKAHAQTSLEKLAAWGIKAPPPRKPASPAPGH